MLKNKLKKVLLDVTDITASISIKSFYGPNDDTTNPTIKEQLGQVIQMLDVILEELK